MHAHAIRRVRTTLPGLVALDYSVTALRNLIIEAHCQLSVCRVSNSRTETSTEHSTTEHTMACAARSAGTLNRGLTLLLGLEIGRHALNAARREENIVWLAAIRGVGIHDVIAHVSARRAGLNR